MTAGRSNAGVVAGIAQPRDAFPFQGRTLTDWLPAIVERIAEQFDPERIVLFGSLARGDAGRDSDIDLLVVFEVVRDARARAIELRLAVADMPAPVDFLVTDRAVLEVRGQAIGSPLATALREGIGLYERQR